MTLCVARRLPNSIRIVTDSRLSFAGDVPPVDFGVKISAIRATVFPWRREGEPNTPDFDQTLGVAVIGSGTTGWIIRELLRSALASVQYPSGIQELSLELVAGLARNVFESVTGSVCNALAGGGLSQFLLVGHCPKLLRPRAFLFEINTTTFPLSAAFTEVLRTSEPLCLGSGAPSARAILRTTPSMSEFKVVKSVIDDSRVTSVGGAVQCGELLQKDFVLRGIEDYVVDVPNRRFSILYCISGFPVYKGPLTGGWTDFPYRQSFLLPFEAEIGAFLEQQFEIT